MKKEKLKRLKGLSAAGFGIELLAAALLVMCWIRTLVLGYVSDPAFWGVLAMTWIGLLGAGIAFIALDFWESGEAYQRYLKSTSRSRLFEKKDKEVHQVAEGFWAFATKDERQELQKELKELYEATADPEKKLRISWFLRDND